ncbi:MAG: dihydropteroate synthase [Rhizobiales bacterium]|nr:dihydropteroate synthase [Hyphomicrobiales bacterium]
MVDTGIGFGKTFTHNLLVLKNASIFHSLGVGILIGASRKAFIGQITFEQDALNRLGGSLAVANFVANAGIQMHRMHDVVESIDQNLINTAIQN